MYAQFNHFDTVSFSAIICLYSSHFVLILFKFFIFLVFVHFFTLSLLVPTFRWYFPLRFYAVLFFSLYFVPSCRNYAKIMPCSLAQVYKTNCLFFVYLVYVCLIADNPCIFASRCLSEPSFLYI